jgi:hypothetical protein
LKNVSAASISSPLNTLSMTARPTGGEIGVGNTFDAARVGLAVAFGHGAVEEIALCSRHRDFIRAHGARQRNGIGVVCTVRCRSGEQSENEHSCK